MFTGLVREVGKVASFADGRLVVEAALQTGLGDSVSVDGVCLTVVENGGGRLAFDVVPETLDRVKPFGDRVNLEPALRAGDPLGGHYVQGHVDGVGRVVSVEPEADATTSRGMSTEWAASSRSSPRPTASASASSPRPSCSATSSRRDRSRSRASRSPSPPSTRSGFEIALIPHTLAETTLSGARRGERRQPRARRARQVRREVAPRYDAPVTMAADTRTESPFATVEEAIEDIRAGRFVVVVDDEDRENEGDLTIAAQFATPGGGQLHGHARARARLPLPDRGALRRARAAADDRPERDAVRHRLHRLGRGARGRHHRHLRARPRAHDPGRRRSVLGAARPRPAGPHLPAARPPRRRAPALRPDRGRGRSRAARGRDPGRRRLRDHEGRRDDGPRARPDRVLRHPRAEDDHRRRPDRVPAPPREARRADHVGQPCRPPTGSSPPSPSARR